MIQISNDVQYVIDRIFLDCATSRVKNLDICGEIDSTISKLDKTIYHRKAKNIINVPFGWKRDNLYVLKVRCYYFSYEITYLTDDILITIEEVAKDGRILTESNMSYSQKEILYESIMKDIAKIVKKHINEARSEEELTEEEANYLHGCCDDWVRQNFKKGDTIILIEEYDYDIEAYCIGHALLKRNGIFLDVRGYMDSMEEVLEPFDFNDDYILEFKTLSEFDKYVKSLEN